MSISNLAPYLRDSFAVAILGFIAGVLVSTPYQINGIYVGIFAGIILFIVDLFVYAHFSRKMDTRTDVAEAKKMLDGLKAEAEKIEKDMITARRKLVETIDTLNKTTDEIEEVKRKTFSFISSVGFDSLEDIIKKTNEEFEKLKENVEGRYGFGGIEERLKKIEEKVGIR